MSAETGEPLLVRPEIVNNTGKILEFRLMALRDSCALWIAVRNFIQSCRQFLVNKMLKSGVKRAENVSGMSVYFSFILRRLYGAFSIAWLMCGVLCKCNYLYYLPFPHTPFCLTCIHPVPIAISKLAAIPSEKPAISL